MKLVNVILFYIILVLFQGLRHKGFILGLYSVSFFYFCVYEACKCHFALYNIGLISRSSSKGIYTRFIFCFIFLVLCYFICSFLFFPLFILILIIVINFTF